MNKGIIIGRLVRKPELRYTINNKAVSNISIATNNSKDDTLFLDINLFGKTAKTTAEYCDKGDLVAIEYFVKNNNYKDKDDKMHYGYKFIGNTIKFLSTNKNDTTESKIKNEKSLNQTDPFAEFGNRIEIDDNFLE